MIDGNQIYSGDHFVMYKKFKLLCCTHRTDIFCRSIILQLKNRNVILHEALQEEGNTIKLVSTHRKMKNARNGNMQVTITHFSHFKFP